jgi:hypothetical protein
MFRVVMQVMLRQTINNVQLVIGDAPANVAEEEEDLEEEAEA